MGLKKDPKLKMEKQCLKKEEGRGEKNCLSSKLSFKLLKNLNKF